MIVADFRLTTTKHTSLSLPYRKSNFRAVSSAGDGNGKTYNQIYSEYR